MPAHGAEPGARIEPVDWVVAHLDPGERAIELLVEYGACGKVITSATETSTSVTLSMQEELRPLGPDEACPAIALSGYVTVPLAARLAGREVLGRPANSSLPTIFGRLPAKTTPCVIGLDPGDARQALRVAALAAHVRVFHRHHGLLRVIAQDPGPGSPVPASGIVRIRIAG